ncbi:hypothetical protein FRC15_011822 [Serendipita sp. 397]|nr:hypothetical protein FRC15_011822 [Serendipita sp. 397]
MEPLLNAASNEDSLVHSSIVTLPFELLLSIASNLPKAERVKLSSTCKRFRSLFFNGIFRGLTIPPSNRKEVAKHKVEGTEKPQEYQSIPDIQLIKSIQETVHSLSVNDLGNELNLKLP